MMYPCEVVGTMHVLLVTIALFNGFLVVFDKIFGMYGTRCKRDKRPFGDVMLWK